MENEIGSEKLEDYNYNELAKNFIDIETFSNFTNKIENLPKYDCHRYS